MTSNLSQALSALDEDFSKVDGYDVVPDGEYWTVVEDLSMELGKFSRHPRLYWSLRILGPNKYDRKLKRVFVVTPASLKWLKRDLFLCGLQLESLAELPDRLENLINLKVRVRKNLRSVYILAVDHIGDGGHLFLHLYDKSGREYLDQQLGQRQHPKDRQDFEGLIEFFVKKYSCPDPSKGFLEDSKTGGILFSTDPA